MSRSIDKDQMLLAIHHESTKAASRTIVQPTMAAGGEASEVLVVLESVVTNVLLHLYDGDTNMAKYMLENAMLVAISRRLDDEATLANLTEENSTKH